jgi:hypothetical protein
VRLAVTCIFIALASVVAKDAIKCGHFTITNFGRRVILQEEKRPTREAKEIRPQGAPLRPTTPVST